MKFIRVGHCVVRKDLVSFRLVDHMTEKGNMGFTINCRVDSRLDPEDFVIKRFKYVDYEHSTLVKIGYSSPSELPNKVLLEAVVSEAIAMCRKAVRDYYTELVIRLNDESVFEIE